MRRRMEQRKGLGVKKEERVEKKEGARKEEL